MKTGKVLVNILAKGGGGVGGSMDPPLGGGGSMDSPLLILFWVATFRSKWPLKVHGAVI